MGLADAKEKEPSRTTRWRMARRVGNWWRPGYHKKKQGKPCLEAWLKAGGDADARRIAEGAWRTRLAPFFSSEREDLEQEIVLRLWELSGHEKFPDRGWRWTVAVNAQRSWLDRLHWEKESHQGLTSMREDYDPFPALADEKQTLDQIRRLVGEKLYKSALRGDRAAIEKVRELVWT